MLEQYVSDVYSKVRVKIDKHSQISDDAGSDEIVYNVRVPVGGGLRCKDVPMVATSTTLTSTTKSLRMRGVVEQIPESSSSFCGECGVVREGFTFDGELPFQTGCNAEICQSDLRVGLNIAGQERGRPYVIGSTERLVLEVTVENSMEDQSEPAYLPSVSVRYPNILQLKQELSSSCQHRQTPHHGLLVCTLAGPLLPGARQRSAGQLTVEAD